MDFIKIKIFINQKTILKEQNGKPQLGITLLQQTSNKVSPEYTKNPHQSVRKRLKPYFENVLQQQKRTHLSTSQNRISTLSTRILKGAQHH